MLRTLPAYVVFTLNSVSMLVFVPKSSKNLKLKVLYLIERDRSCGGGTCTRLTRSRSTKSSVLRIRT